MLALKHTPYTLKNQRSSKLFPVLAEFAVILYLLGSLFLLGIQSIWIFYESNIKALCLVLGVSNPLCGEHSLYWGRHRVDLWNLNNGSS